MLVTLGAALEKTGMPQLSFTWGGLEARAVLSGEGSAVTFLGPRESNPGRLVLI